MLGRAASCCDLLRLSPTPGDSSEDDERRTRTSSSRVTHCNVVASLTHHEYIIYVYTSNNNIVEFYVYFKCCFTNSGGVIAMMGRRRVRFLYNNFVLRLIHERTHPTKTATLRFENFLSNNKTRNLARPARFYPSLRLLFNTRTSTTFNTRTVPQTPSPFSSYERRGLKCTPPLIPYHRQRQSLETTDTHILRTYILVHK